MSHCPICNVECSVEVAPDTDAHRVKCPDCGRFTISDMAVEFSAPRLPFSTRVQLSQWLRQASDAGQPIKLSTEFIQFFLSK